MTKVILLALASTTCSAISTVLKHVSANRPVSSRLADRLPGAIARTIGNWEFLLALVVDAAAVTLQVLALRLGNLSTVQPILTLALVISLGLDHLAARSRITRGEFLSAALLVGGLVLFLTSSGATHPPGGHDAGDTTRGLILALAAAAAWNVALAMTRSARPTVRARVIAAGVAAIYASTAGLIKSATRILQHDGPLGLAASWQLWLLLAVGAAGLVLNQRVFGLAPLHVSLPVIASLDPLFSVAIGRVVFDERLLATPTAAAVEVSGIAILLTGVVRLSRSQSDPSAPGAARTAAASQR